MELTGPQKHRLRAENRVLRRRARMLGIRVHEYVRRHQAQAGERPALDAAQLAQIGQEVAARVRGDPARIAREVARILRERLSPAAAPETAAEPGKIRVDDVREMLDQLLERPETG